MQPKRESELPYETRDFGVGSVKDVDIDTMTVTGYYASFGNVDADEDVFVQGAFEESIEEWGPNGSGRITHLNQHHVDQPIGAPDVLREDDFGLYFETSVVDTRIGEDVLKMYDAGVYEHSVGFVRKGEEQRDDGVTLITKAQLWEGSNVTFGANPETPFTGFKSAADIQAKMEEQARRLRSVLQEGLTKGVAHQLEIGLRQLEAQSQKLDEFLSGKDEGNKGDSHSSDEEEEEEEEVQKVVNITGSGQFFDFAKAKEEHEKEREKQNSSTFFEGV